MIYILYCSMFLIQILMYLHCLFGFLKDEEQGWIFFCLPPPSPGMHIFSPIGKQYSYFSLIDLKFRKLQKKRLNIFRLLNIVNFIWGKNINQKGGGKKMYFKYTIMYHPWQGINNKHVWMSKKYNIHFFIFNRWLIWTTVGGRDGEVKLWDRRSPQSAIVRMFPEGGESRRDCWTVAHAGADARVVAAGFDNGDIKAGVHVFKRP